MLRLDSFLPISIRRNHRRHHPSHGNGDNLPGRCGNQQTNFHVLPAPTPVRRLSFNLLQFSLLVICPWLSDAWIFDDVLCVNKITVVKSPWTLEFFYVWNREREFNANTFFFIFLFLILIDFLKISIVGNFSFLDIDCNVVLVTNEVS